MDELVYRDVVRKYLDPRFEWLSKISSKEYHKWKTALYNLYPYRHLTEVQKDEKILEEIELKERQYQRHLSEWKENRRRNRKLDAQIHKKLDLLHDLVASPGTPNAILKDNGLTKHKGKDVCLGGSIVRMDKYEPITASTKLTRHDKKHIPIGYRKLYKEDMANKNGRIYDPIAFKNLDWMRGEFSHPDPPLYSVKGLFK